MTIIIPPRTEATEEMWCARCQIHRAMPLRPLCPSCADDKAREIREGQS